MSVSSTTKGFQVSISVPHSSVVPRKKKAAKEKETTPRAKKAAAAKKAKPAATATKKKAPAAKRATAVIKLAMPGERLEIPLLVVESGKTVKLIDGGGMMVIRKILVRGGGKLIDETKGSSNVQIGELEYEPNAAVISSF